MNHQMHPNSLANLKPHHFKKGHDSRRRIGARSAGATIREWWNTLCVMDDDGYALYDDEELRCIADDPKESHPKRLAAKEILQAHEEGLTKFGKRLGGHRSAARGSRRRTACGRRSRARADHSCRLPPAVRSQR